jgi:hypothetical protein
MFFSPEKEPAIDYNSYLVGPTRSPGFHRINIHFIAARKLIQRPTFMEKTK